MVDVLGEIFRGEENIQLEVAKSIELEFDLGSLLGTDINPLDLKKLRTETEDYLKDLSRNNTQLLINSIWKLPTERYENVLLVKLPPPSSRLPREKPVPKPKPPTKWEEFAKKKGIVKRKKENLTWQENTQEWKPRWGYRSKQNTDIGDWMIEIPDNADPYTDYFGKKKEEKKERVAKNEFQRLRNIARAQKIKVPAIGITPSENQSRIEVKKALALAKTSTASLGKFTDSLPKEEKKAKHTKKRKFEPVISDMNKEKQKNLNILEQLWKKKPKLDINKGINERLRHRMKSQTKKKENSRGKIREMSKKRHKGYTKNKKGRKDATSKSKIKKSKKT